MNTTLRISNRLIGLVLCLSTWWISGLSSQASFAQSPKLVRRAGPIRFKPHRIPGPATLPDSVKFGLVCEIGGFIQTDDWKAIGTVIEHSPGLLTFRTEEFRVRGKVRDASQVGRLAYRLPHGLLIPLSEGDPITIMHDHDTNEKRVERDIHISSGKQLVFATSHRHDDSPPRSAENAERLFDGAPGGNVMFYWSNPSNDDRNQELKVMGAMSAPVSLRVRDGNTLKQIKTEHDGVTSVTLDSVEYHFVVLSSEYTTDDSHGHEEEEHSESAHVDGDSHSLECLIVRAH